VIPGLSMNIGVTKIFKKSFLFLPSKDHQNKTVLFEHLKIDHVWLLKNYGLENKKEEK
jgi:hypothetical protein